MSRGSSPFRLVMAPMGVCRHLDGSPPHTLRAYSYLQKQGFNTVVLGYLDFWDERFSQLDFYGHAEVLPDLIPREYRERNREELNRRLRVAEEAGLRVFLSVSSPLGPQSKTKLDEGPPNDMYPGGFVNDATKTWGHLLGPTGELCLGIEAVRAYYRELIVDIVRSFPAVAGFTFFGGDFYSSVCDARCPRCGSRPAWLRYMEWVEDLAALARAENPQVETYVHSWPWWNETFDMLEHASPSTGFLLPPAWGFHCGREGKRPILTDEWYCLDPQAGRMPVDEGSVLGSVTELSQPWGTIIEVSQKFQTFLARATAKGNRVIAWDERVISEVAMPYFLPMPFHVLGKLRQLESLGVEGIEEFWGVHRHEALGWRVNINTLAQKQYLKTPESSDEEILRELAVSIYGSEPGEYAVAAWRSISAALNHWAIIAWRQRMHWHVDTTTAAFYVRDLTQTPPRTGAIRSEPAADLGKEIWQALHDNLSEVISGYDKAIDLYSQIIERTEGEAREPAVFHRDCITLGGCFHTMARHTCLAQIAAQEGGLVEEAVMIEAVANLEQIRELADDLSVFEYNRRLYVDAIANMRRYLRENIVHA